MDDNTPNSSEGRLYIILWGGAQSVTPLFVSKRKEEKNYSTFIVLAAQTLSTYNYGTYHHMVITLVHHGVNWLKTLRLNRVLLYHNKPDVSPVVEK